MFFWVVLALVAVVVSLVVLVAWSSWRKNQRDKAFASYVWLRKTPQKFTAHGLARMISPLAGEPLTHGATPGPGVVCQMPQSPDTKGNDMFVVALSKAPLGVIACDRAYFSDLAEAMALFKDRPELCEALEKHVCWSAVDALDVEGMADKEHAGRVLARVAREMADDGCLALMVRPHGRMYLYNEKTLAALGAQDPVASLKASDLMVHKTPDDVEMQAAWTEAKSRFGEFEAALSKGGQGMKFSVKAPFVAGKGDLEFIWVDVTKIQDGVAYGTLGNDPVDLPGRKLGDAVEVPVAEIDDWIIFDTKTQKMVGGFTTKVLMKG